MALFNSMVNGLAIIGLGILFIGLILPWFRVNWLSHQGRKRAFLLHRPRSAAHAPNLPLVLVLHGAGGSVWRISRFARFTGFNHLADQENFMVAYPIAWRKRWNDSNREATQSCQDIDDVAFIHNLIEHVAQRYEIDRERVYAVGISNGGAMTYRLSCELADSFAAIATVSSFFPLALAHHCPARHPLPVLIMNGTEDPLIPLQGGWLQFRQKRLGQILALEAVVSYWIGRNGCHQRKTIPHPASAEDGTRVQHDRYCTAQGQTGLELYTIQGGGHTWPGSRQYLPTAWVGRTSQAINASEQIWDFFKRHSHLPQHGDSRPDS